ncbi:MAG TPA: hypothetical protein EYH54_01415 [Nautiliaceae bacterium]|nr:hypothetical protein [Nautiliaceae bacterium]
MKINFLEKIIKNKKIVKLNYFTIDLEEGEQIQVYDLKYYSKKIQKFREELSKKLNELLKKEEYNLTENLKNYAIFNSLIEDYVGALETEFNLNLEKNLSKNSSLIINNNYFHISLSPKEVFKIIEETIKQKKNVLVEIITDLDKKKVEHKVTILKENKKKN